MTVLAPQPRPTDRGHQPPPLPRVDPISRLPILILYPHSRCNCRCLMCDIWRAEGRREVSAERVRQWLPEWRRLGVERVVLSGGEPLMHSDLTEMGESLRRAGIGVTLVSTGLLLARHAHRLGRFCDDVVVSLDGPREIHDRIRNVPSAYERLAAGVAAVRAADASIRLTGRCTVQRWNYGSLAATVGAAHELGLAQISFLAVDVSSEAFNRPGGWPAGRRAEVALAADDLPRLAAELERLERRHAADFASGFIAESPDRLRRRLYDYFAALLGRGQLPPVACNAPWVSTVVEADGTVRPCFFQPPLGRLDAATGLAEILNAPQAVAWRQGLDTARDAICRRCVCSLQLRETEPPAAGGGER